MAASREPVSIDAGPEDATPNDRAAGERALMRAVLIDAIRCLVERRRTRGHAEEAARAREWIETRDDEWPFSFDSICEALGLDAARLRRRLHDEPGAVALALASRKRGRRGLDPDVADTVARFVEMGHSPRQVAAMLGVTISSVTRVAAARAGDVIARRNADIRRLRAAGWTLRTIAARFGLSKPMIVNICSRIDDAAPDAADGRQDRIPPGAAP